MMRVMQLRKSGVFLIVLAVLTAAVAGLSTVGSGNPNAEVGWAVVQRFGHKLDGCAVMVRLRDDHAQVNRVAGQPVDPFLHSVYPALASFAGQPSTAFPAGLSRDGLPIGLQAIGPYLEDRTPIRFAELVTKHLGGFRPPPAFVE